MTVKELIEKLEKMPKDFDVAVFIREVGVRDIYAVSEQGDFVNIIVESWAEVIERDKTFKGE